MCFSVNRFLRTSPKSLTLGSDLALGIDRFLPVEFDTKTRCFCEEPLTSILSFTGNKLILSAMVTTVPGLFGYIFVTYELAGLDTRTCLWIALW